MQEWEYKTFHLAKPQNHIEHLNRLGREGGKPLRWCPRGGWAGAGCTPSSC